MEGVIVDMRNVAIPQDACLSVFQVCTPGSSLSQSTLNIAGIHGPSEDRPVIRQVYTLMKDVGCQQMW